MQIQHQHLRMFRKRTPLLQCDIAYLLSMREDSSISRWEKGERQPAIDMLLIYHLLFDIPMEHVFESQKLGLLDTVKARIRPLIERLQGSASDPKVGERIAFLQSALTRLQQ